MKKQKTAKQIERHLKGVANHYRIDILFLVARKEGITLDSLVAAIGANSKTISEHTRRLVQSGLLNKKYRGKFVEHSLSPYGRIVVRFLKMFRALQ
ncbi:hypothetical protein COV04_02945 [Candidatus Uhrbacteria bacterium CG10_big_fil_rev_8_21_14_0_10_48_11]|uniref:HTH arsR-type domain-containing protein n=1 Tax=Candidatus Uhrbacteria bacterium CG10_big_fil_rev_8_21_14_0_10_48_11 TaxID=1975037 RepID=A0A2M8LEK7_9BACT|nr:MAG: hypothetical protein COV04_02945 [Candidatus Uhrbacteria bacterium CG10_big_fil_rev_8_21_14_0_10_48_11]